MKVLSVHLGHDSSCCLLVDGKVVAAASEERFSRLKHDSLVPLESIKFCLEGQNVKISEIDLITFPAMVTRQELKVLFNLEKNVVPTKQGENVNKDLMYYIKHFLISVIQKLNQTTLIELPSYMKSYDASKIEILNVEHHLAHAASSYLGSGFKEKTLVITSDGSGDGSSLTVWLGEKGRLTPLQKVGRDGSLGAFYGTVTEALGWIVGDGEGKTMGLAPYGNCKKTKGVLEFIRPRYKNGKLVKKYDWGWPGMWFDEATEHWHFQKSSKVKKLAEKYGRENIAAEAQRVLEEELVGIVSYWIKKTNTSYLATSGGVFLNVKANQRIWETGLLKDYYVYPDAGDGGVAVGAALYGYSVKKGNKNIKRIDTAYFGPSYSDLEIEKLLKVRQIKYKKLSDRSLINTVSKLLSKGKIIGWFQGKMEVGPRALGNRSILMDPRNAENKDIINSRVKYREAFRPFCPSLIDKTAGKYLKNIPESPFMIISCDISEEMKDKIPAVTHVDGTLRPQVVTKKANAKYYSLIESFGKITKVDVLLNTSFNVKGEPIVCTPQDAIKCFYDTGMDYLVLGNLLISK